MRISSLEVVGLRSINRASLKFDNVTALIGGNNAGKSTILHALRLFFEAAPKFNQDDFHKREAESIEIIVSFDQLCGGELDEFGGVLHDGKLTISRTLSSDKDRNLTYSVKAKTYPSFNVIRAETNKTSMRTMFNSLASELQGLERASNAEEVLQNMEAWERENPSQLEFCYVRGFFGAPNVANGKLRKKTSLHFIPAVVDVPEETSDSKRSPIISLLSEIAKQTYENREEVSGFIQRTQIDFESLISPENFPQLGEISDRLTVAIQKYYGDSRLLAEWRSEDGVKFSFPQPTIRVEDNGFLSGLEYVGHGLQRAALFSVIEFLAQSNVDRIDEGFDEPQSDIILLIEEPEIYQHPHKQKLVASAFRSICEGFSRSTGIRFQVVFATHSEKFVDLDYFHTARIVRRSVVGEETVHAISALSIGDCSRYFANLLQREPMPDHAFLAKLHIFSREMCEGFFAQKVILVEGVSDKAVLEGIYRSLGRDNLSEGIVIISSEGKTKMDKPFYIFNKLGIPTYAVFDSDLNSREKKPSANILLQSIAGVETPSKYPVGCYARYAAFERNLEGYAEHLCGDQWQLTLKAVAEHMELHPSDICKTPQAVGQVFERLRGQGIDFPMLEEIVERVESLSSW